MKKRKISKKSFGIVKVLDDLMDEYENNPLVIFLNEKDRKTHIHSQFVPKLKKWEQQRECAFFGCSKLSIKRSHTISRGAHLEKIAEKGHVISPQYNIKTGKTAIDEIGLKDASVFPGFCTEHECLFKNFEETKQGLIDGDDYVYQMYRTVVRENVSKKIKLEIYESYIKDYKEKINEWATKKVDHFFKKQGSTSQVKKVNVGGGKTALALLEAEIEKIKLQEEYIQKKILNPFHIMLVEEKKTDKLCMIFFKITVEFPFAMSGQGDFKYPLLKIKGVESNEVNIFYFILPQNGESVVGILVEAELKNTLEEYLNCFCWSGLGSLVMIESWMLNGSDHWFIKPSYWNNFNGKKKTDILNYVGSTEFNILHNPKISVFDDIRKIGIEEILKNKKYLLSNPKIETFLKNEMKKINYK